MTVELIEHWLSRFLFSSDGIDGRRHRHRSWHLPVLLNILDAATSNSNISMWTVLLLLFRAHACFRVQSVLLLQCVLYFGTLEAVLRRIVEIYPGAGFLLPNSCRAVLDALTCTLSAVRSGLPNSLAGCSTASSTNHLQVLKSLISN